MKNLEKHYRIQSLHRIATFLWPNFRLLKMLTTDEQKEVHEDVRRLLQSPSIAIKENDDNENDDDAEDDDYNNSGGDNGNCDDLPVNYSNKPRNESFGSRNSTSSESSFSANNRSNIKNFDSRSSSKFDEWESFSDFEDKDEVDKYLSVQLTSCTEHSVLQWWKEHSIDFPKLSRLAKWILSVPASVTTLEKFNLNRNFEIDDNLLFLHCNMQTEKFQISSHQQQQSAMLNTKNSTSTANDGNFRTKNLSQRKTLFKNKNYQKQVSLQPLGTISSNNINYATSLILNNQ